jgi:hypothetical protein
MPIAKPVYLCCCRWMAPFHRIIMPIHHSTPDSLQLDVPASSSRSQDTHACPSVPGENHSRALHVLYQLLAHVAMTVFSRCLYFLLCQTIS